MKFLLRWIDQDLVGMMAAFFLSYYVRNTVLGPEIQPFDEYLRALPAVALILLITFYSLSHEHILELIHRCEATDVKFKVVSDLFEIVAGGIDLNELEGLPSLDLRKSKPSFPN